MSNEKYFKQPSSPGAGTHFQNVPSANIERSKFDRSHGVKGTMNAGELMPYFVDEVLPGDTFSIKSTNFTRLATPLKPVFDNIYVDTHFFFVPNRLVWDNWENFCGQRDSPEDDPNIYTVPTTGVNLNLNDSTKISNAMGIPQMTLGTNTVQVNALPFRAYLLIWNEWYRDENLQVPIPVDTGDAGGIIGLIGVLKRGKRKDYFTSCLPWPQKGDPVFIPLGTSAPITGLGKFNQTFPTSTQDVYETGQSGTVEYADASAVGDGDDNVNNLFYAEEDPNNAGFPGIFADLTAATAVTINDLRTAFQIQKLLERDARGGTRYPELILAHYGVRSDDARLNRPEYLSGSSSELNISPVVSNMADPASPLGDLAAVGTAVAKAGFKKSFTEHGYVIGITSARADLTYQQGLERQWSRQTRYDYYWPSLSHLGEQATLNKELYIGLDDAVNNAVFGYQERYAEYRYKPSRIVGLFSSEDALSLDVWHLGQDFAALPSLNSDFIEEAPPIDRIVAVPSEPDFLCDIWYKFICDRPMPVYSVPGLVDHF